MAKKLFVGGLSFDTTDEGLQQAFGAFGTLKEAKIIRDRANGRSRGFGFVSFADEAEADRALQQMNGAELDSRTIRVDHANARPRGGGRAGDSW
jgi:RNA recognition motif-containing protein